jgi:hypothetical protein
MVIALGPERGTAFMHEVDLPGSIQKQLEAGEISEKAGFKSWAVIP